MAAVAGVLVFVPGVGPQLPEASAQTCANATIPPYAGSPKQSRAAMYCLINGARLQAGRTPLRVNWKLQRSATLYATQMVDERFFAHTGPDGADLTDRTRRSGYLKRYRVWVLGENIAWGASTLGSPARVMCAIGCSPAHRRNLLNPRFREVGVGVAIGTPFDSAAGATYVQDFGWRAR